MNPPLCLLVLALVLVLVLIMIIILILTLILTLILRCDSKILSVLAFLLPWLNGSGFPYSAAASLA